MVSSLDFKPFFLRLTFIFSLTFRSQLNEIGKDLQKIFLFNGCLHKDVIGIGIGIEIKISLRLRLVLQS